MRRLLLMMALIVLLASCRQGTESYTEPYSKPLISVTILPEQYFIEQLAGSSLEVLVMVPPGASPATYEPTVSQLRKLDQSIAYMQMGHLGFELAWMERIRKINRTMKIVDLSEGIDLMEETYSEGIQAHLHRQQHHGIDPHTWMSVINARIISGNIYKALLDLFPEDSLALTGRYQAFLLELDSLHATISESLSGLEEKNFMVYHPALTYFARDYNLVQHALETGGKTPSPAQMKRMIDLGRQYQIHHILIQSQFDRWNAEVLAQEIGATVVQFDPLDPDWKKQMLYIASQFKKPLQ